MEPTPDLIELRGLRLTGIHGLLAEERHRAQPFEIDLDLEVDMRAAGPSDDLADTVDYGAITAAVAAEVAGPPADLLEHLAHRIASAALTTALRSARPPTEATGPAVTGGAVTGPAVTGVTVAVRKLRPPVPHDLASAGVRIHRRVSDLPIRDLPASDLPASDLGASDVPGGAAR